MLLEIVGRKPVVSGPTNVSKKAQVFRDSLRRKTTCSAESADSRAASGRLSHQARHGDAAHNSSERPRGHQYSGPEAMPGRGKRRRAMTGATHIRRNN